MKSITHYSIPSAHPAFAGHFPGRSMFPGALLLDQLLLGITRVCDLDLTTCEIQSIKFLSPALPGDELEFRFETVRDDSLGFDISAGSRKIASGTLKTVAR